MSQTFLEDIPEFLEIQRNSFLRILDTGLIEALETINPISPPPHCEYGLLFYPKEYVLVLQPHTSSQEEAFLQGKTYGCKIYVPAITLNSRTEKESRSQSGSNPLKLTFTRDHKLRKEWICIGVLPLMSRRGHFIINGSPRIVISQMSRAPGLYYQTGEKLQATVVPSKGAWFRMSVKVSKKGETKVWVRITPYRKMPYTIFLETYKNLENPESFTQSEFLDLAYKSFNNQIKDFDKQYGVGQIRRQINLTIRNSSSYTLGTLGRKRLNERLGDNSQKRYLTTKDISTIKNTLLDLLDQKNYTGPADDIDHLENRRVRTCGELLQSEIEVGMSRLKKAVVKQLDTYSNPDSSLFMSPKSTTTSSRNSSLKKKNVSVDKDFSSLSCAIATCKAKEAKQAIAVPAYGGVAPQVVVLRTLQSKYSKTSKKDLQEGKQSKQGKPSTCIAKTASQEKQASLLPLLAKQPNSEARASFVFANCIAKEAKQSKTQQKEQPPYAQLKSEKRNDCTTRGSSRSFKLPSPSKIISTKAFAGALREFFGSNPLSQYMDQTNPLAEITHKRRLSSLGPGGVDRASAGIAIRGIHPTHYGRICPIETPEGKNAGLVNSMTMWARLNRDGFLQTPYLKVKGGSVMTHTPNLSPAWEFVPTKQEGCLQENQGLKIVASDLKIPKSSFLPQIALPTRDGSERNFVRRNRHVIDFFGVSPVQNISVATSLIPFLEHDDATRALMGSNMQRQAVPLLKPQAPLIRTGLEAKVVGESGHALQAASSGFISSATKTAITIDSFTENKNSVVHLTVTHRIAGGMKPTSFPFFSGIQALLMVVVLRSKTSKKASKKMSRNNIFFNYSVPCYASSLAYFARRRRKQVLLKQKQAKVTTGLVKSPTFFSFLPCFCYLQSKRSKVNTAGCTHAKAVALQSKQKINNRSGYRRPYEVKSFAFNPSWVKTKQKVHRELLFSTFALLTGLTFTRSSKYSKHKKQADNSTVWYKDAQRQRIREIQTLQQYTRSNQATVCVQRPAVTEGQWVQKGDLLADCSASSRGVLALGQNIVVAYLPMEGFNFEDAIVVSDRLVHEELYTSIHVERVEFDMEAVPQKNILLPVPLASSKQVGCLASKSKKPRLLKVKSNRNAVTAAKTLQQDWITAHNPHLHLREKDALDALGIIKIGSWVGPNDVLVSKVFPVEKTLAPSRHLLLAVFKDKKSELASQLETTDTSVRVPKGIHGRVINIQILYTGKIKPSAESAFITGLTAKNNTCITNALTCVQHEEPVLLRDIAASRLEKAKQKNRKSLALSSVYSLSPACAASLACLLALLRTCKASSKHHKQRGKQPLDCARNESKAFFFALLTICFAYYLPPVCLPLAPSLAKQAKDALGGLAVLAQQSKLDLLTASVEQNTCFAKQDSTAKKTNTVHTEKQSLEKEQLTTPLNSAFQLLAFAVLTPCSASCLLGSAKALAKLSKQSESNSVLPLATPVATLASTIFLKSVASCKAKQRIVLAKHSKQVSLSSFRKEKYKKQRLEKTVHDKEFKIIQVRIYIAERKKLQVGDKMSGRHGNKGIVSTILPREDMPYLPDGTCVDIVLNPLGIPSRMNVGQVFECLLGLAATVCGDIISHTPFDEMYGPEASRSLVYLFLYSARLRARADWLFQPRFPGKTVLFDGRTGTPFEQWVTVGRAYMLKLIHMVDEKIHARSVGSRSIVTQQPVKGRARGGGQRVGEMEVWAFEGFGAAYTLQELLTIKSDDIFGRERVEDRIISSNTVSAHVPETFKILLFELRCLCLNVELNAKNYPRKN